MRKVFVVLTLSLLSFSTIADELQEVKVVLFGGALAAGIYVAQDTGLFAEEGIEVSVKHTPDSIYLATELVKGNYDIAQASIDNFFAYQGGQGAVPLDREPDLRVFMGGSTFKIDLVVGEEIDGYDDIKGQPLGVDALTTGWAFVLKDMLRKGGLEESDYTFVESGSTEKRINALKAGEYRATLMAGQYLNEAYELGFKRLDDSLSSIGPYQGTSFAASKAWIEDNADIVEGFCRAYIKATDILYDQSRRDEVVEIIANHIAITPAVANKTLDELTSGDFGFTPKAAMDAQGVATVLALRDEYGYPEADLSNMDDFVDLSYYEKAIKSLETAK
jgi:ABC-type nitrate/sulfonate/bicarbonate transport system substrate-binding protein